MTTEHLAIFSSVLSGAAIILAPAITYMLTTALSAERIKQLAATQRRHEEAIAQLGEAQRKLVSELADRLARIETKLDALETHREHRELREAQDRRKQP
jgi:hypothetical protein